MPFPRTLLRAAIVRALLFSVLGTPTPAIAACAGPSVVDLTAELAGAARHDLGAGPLPAVLPMWGQHRREPLPALPDAVTVFTLDERTLAIAYLRSGCLVGLLPVAAAELWHSLFTRIGPIA